MSPNWALYQRNAPCRPGYGAWAASGGGGGGTPTDDGGFIHTSEPTDANTILAEDFMGGYGRRPLDSWAEDTYDWCVATGTLNGNNNAGWGASSYTGVGVQQAAAEGWPRVFNVTRMVRTNNTGLFGKRACGTTGPLPQSIPSPNPGTSCPNFVDVEVGLNAFHNLKGGDTGEVWIRCYIKLSSDWAYGSGEKFLTINSFGSTGGIDLGGWGYGIGNGPPFGNVIKYVTINPPDIIYEPNLVGSPPWTSIAMQANHWYYLELHLKLDTNGSNGIVEWWQNDGGTSTGGDWTAQTPTKIASYTNVDLAGASSGNLIGALWFEQYDHNGTGYTGERRLDAIMVQKGARAGPIGFADRASWGL